MEIVVYSIVAVATVVEAMTLALVEVVMVAVEVVVVMQIFSAKFTSNWVT